MAISMTPTPAEVAAVCLLTPAVCTDFVEESTITTRGYWCRDSAVFKFGVRVHILPFPPYVADYLSAYLSE